MKDASALEETRKKPCIVCGLHPADACHIKSKGAGGGDEAWNILPFCRFHHDLQHRTGWARFLAIYPWVDLELKNMGWENEMCNGRFIMTNKHADK